MFWAISCQICVWHNFWGSCLKRWFYKFIKEIHLTSCEGHSWSIVSIFLICAPKDSWRKIRRTCPPEKTFRIICGGYPSTNVLRYSQMTSSENNCERYIFSAQKVCEGMLPVIFPTFLEGYFLVFRKNIS